MLTHRSATRAGAAALLAGAILLAGCGSDADEASDPSTTEAADTTEAAAEEIAITDVWARKSPMATTAGAAYLNITSPVDDELVGASVSEDIAGTVEIHETVMAEEDLGDDTTETTMGEDMGDDMTETTMGEDMGDEDMGDEGEMEMGDGAMTMRPIEALELPAGEEVSLEPGGYHIMLLDLVAPLEVGDTFDIVLTFASGAEQTVTAEVREA